MAAAGLMAQHELARLQLHALLQPDSFDFRGERKLGAEHQGQQQAFSVHQALS